MLPPPENDELSEEDDHQDLESGGSEYQPSELAISSTDDSHPDWPPFQDEMPQNADVFPQSEESCDSVVFRMLKATSVKESRPSDYSKTPLDSQIRKAFQNITVAGEAKMSNTGKRNYSKPDYCLYCKQRYLSKICALYMVVLAKQARVAEILELPPGSKERKRCLTMLQNEGNHLHNCEVLKHGVGELTVFRRPGEKSSTRADIYLPCSECKAWVLEASLAVHSRSCPAGSSVDRNLSRNSKMLISPLLVLDTDHDEIDDIIFKMKETTKHPGLENFCGTDTLIREFCRGLLHKLGSEDEQRRKDKDNIRTKLRTVGRLLINLNHQAQQNSDLSHYLTPKCFMLVVRAVREMGNETPNLALTLGHYVKQICQLKRSLYLQNDDEQGKKD